MFIRHLSDRGDTIVEVLIALAVTSLLLGGALVTTTRSLTGARQSQDQAEALKITESQAEALRFMGWNNLTTAGTNFCIIAGVATPAACVTSAAPGIPYTTIVTRPSAVDPTTSHMFTITTRWDRAGGSGNSQLNIAYTVY